MNCSNHFENKATNTCNVCGKWFCEDCILEIEGRIYCKSCLKNKLSENSEINKVFHKKQPNDLISLFLSLIPGCGQMYLGFMQRGILILVLFIALLSSIEHLSIVLWIFSFFDTFKLKNDLQKGIYIEDNIKDIKNFIVDNKKILIISILLIIIPMYFYKIKYLSFRFLKAFRFNHYEDILPVISMIISFIIIIITLVIIIKIFKNNKNKDIDNKQNKQ